jgi:hypothetical protein
MEEVRIYQERMVETIEIAKKKTCEKIVCKKGYFLDFHIARKRAEWFL